MMDWLKETITAGRDALQVQVGRYKNREFMEAVVAGCAMVAAADGTIAPVEKQKMIGFIRISPELKVFDTARVIEAFEKSVEAFDFDFEIGCQEALKLTAKLRNHEDASRTMIRVCCLIGASDGNFDDDEKRAVSRICRSVDLLPTEFNLPA